MTGMSCRDCVGLGAGADCAWEGYRQGFEKTTGNYRWILRRRSCRLRSHRRAWIWFLEVADGGELPGRRHLCEFSEKNNVYLAVTLPLLKASSWTVCRTPCRTANR